MLNKKESILDKLFLKIGEIVYIVKTKGISAIEIENNRDDIVNQYLNKSIGLIKEGITFDVIDVELEYKIKKMCIRKNIDDISLKALHIIKLTIYPIANGDCDKILCIANNYVDSYILNKISLDLEA